jgi:hypothetical protein
VDLSEKYDIRFVAADPREAGLLKIKAGDLVADELRMMVPAGWRVALSSRAEKGYPVRMRPETGGAVIVVDRLAGQSVDLTARSGEAARQLGLEAEALGQWTPLRRPTRHRAREAFSTTARQVRDEAGERRLVVWLLRPTGGRADFLLSAEAPEGEWSDTFEKTIDLAFGSLRFRKPDHK